MFVTDFEFDGKLLSEQGYMIGYSDGIPESITNGSEITLNTTPFQNGMLYELTTTTYNECLTTTFNVYKDPCVFGNEYVFSMEEIREMMRWLNRKKFYSFRFMDGDYMNLEYRATFTNISREFCGGDVIGLVLTLQTDKPFAYGRTIVKTFSGAENNWTFIIGCDSDEESDIYPHMTIKLNEPGTLTLYNKFNDVTTVVKNCQDQETITLDYPLVESDNDNHKLQNDFNYRWFSIGTKFRERRNIVTVSLPCTIKLEYAPIIKIGLL